MNSQVPGAEFYVAVPSYRRETVIEEKTLALLARHSIPANRVYIFVANDDERQRYVAQLGDAWPNIVVGVPTLWRQRNFITNYFDEGCHVVSLDDDVEDLFQLQGDPLNGGVLEPLHAGGLVDIIQDAWKKMHRLDICLWALNVSFNPYFMNNDKHGCGLTLKNGLCNGFFWGCRIRKTPELLLQYGDGHEDIERTVRHLDFDSAVFRYREFCATTRCKINAGGLQSSMSAKERKAEEERSIRLLAEEFPLLLELKPGSKLGAKFRSVLSAFRRHSTLGTAQFQKCSALKKLNLLVGARCAFPLPDTRSGGFRGYRLCTVEFGRSDIGMLGFKTQDGQLLCASTWAFNDAIAKDLLFVLWLPVAACTALAIGSAGDIKDLPWYLDQDRAKPISKPVQQIASTSAPPFMADAKDTLSEFGAYLDALACDDAGGEEDSEEDIAEKQSAPDQSKAKVLPNAARKKSGKHEDPGWIESQRTASTSSQGASPEAHCEQKQLNILTDWAITTDFDTALQQAVAGKAATSEASSASGAVNELFCASRIWAGGWGGQCTRARLEGDTYCTMHRTELGRQGYLTHGRIDGAIPPKKRKEFEKWQKLLRGREENVSKPAVKAGGRTLTDSADFSEEGWREMGRGAGESARAFEFRTGLRMEPDQRKRKTPADEDTAAIGASDTITDDTVQSLRKRPASTLDSFFVQKPSEEPAEIVRKRPAANLDIFFTKKRPAAG